MAKEILLYWGVSDWSVAHLISQLEEFKKQKVTLRVNSPGGSVFSAFGLYAKIREHGDVHVKIDGIAASAAGILPLYAKTAECLDVSTGMVHRASMDGSDKDLTPEQKLLLDKVNLDLRGQMEKRVAKDKFKTITGHTIDDMFSMEGRLNIWLNAKQMEDLGIVSKVNPLTPEIEQRLAEASTDWSSKIAASYNGAPQTDTQTNDNMTPEEFKTKFPAAHAAIVAEGVSAGEKAGIKKEQDRVAAWMAYAAIDPKRVAKAVVEGEEMSIRAIAEFNAQALTGDRLKKLEGDSAGDVQVDASAQPAAKTAKEKEIASFEALLDKDLGFKKKQPATV